MLKLLLLFCLVVEIWSGKSKKSARGSGRGGKGKSGKGERAHPGDLTGTIDAEITISAYSLSGETHSFAMRTSDTVKDLKELIEDKTGKDYRLQKITQGSEELGNEHRFEGDCEVNYTLDARVIIVKVYNESEELLLDIATIRVKTVSWLKRRIHNNFRYPILTQDLQVWVEDEDARVEDDDVRVEDEDVRVDLEDDDSFEALGRGSSEIVFKYKHDSTRARDKLLDHDLNVRKNAVQSLKDLAEMEPSVRERTAVLACVCLRDAAEGVRNEALEIIETYGTKGDPSIIRLVTLHLQDGRSFVRTAAVKALGKIIPDDVTHDSYSIIIDHLIQQLGDVQLCVRSKALEILGQVAQHGDRTVVEAILPLLPLLRERLLWEKAAETLGKVARKGDAEVIQALRRLIFFVEADLEARRAALIALKDLSEVGDEDTMTVLLDLIQNDLRRPWSLIHEALYALARIARPDDDRAYRVMQDVLDSRVGSLDNGREAHLTHVGKAAKDGLRCLKLRKRDSQQ